MNAMIDIDHCINCKICENVCQVKYPLEKKKSSCMVSRMEQ